MDIWAVYDFMVNRVHAFMVSQNECLYNALVLTLAGAKRTKLEAAGPELTRAELLKIRDTALNVIRMVEDEIQKRDEEDGDECPDCGRFGDHHCPAWCDRTGCEKCYPLTYGGVR